MRNKTGSTFEFAVAPIEEKLQPASGGPHFLLAQEMGERRAPGRGFSQSRLVFGILATGKDLIPIALLSQAPPSENKGYSRTGLTGGLVNRTAPPDNWGYCPLNYRLPAEHNEVNLNFMPTGGRHTPKIEGVAPYSRAWRFADKRSFSGAWGTQRGPHNAKAPGRQAARSFFRPYRPKRASRKLNPERFPPSCEETAQKTALY